MNRWLSVIVAAALPASAGCDPAFFLDWPLQGMRDDARRLHGEGRYGEAAHLYEGALRRVPRNRGLEAELSLEAAACWLSEADGHLAAGRTDDARLPLDRALAHYRRAAELVPARDEPYAGAAAVYRRQGRADLSRQVLATRVIPRRGPTEPAPGLPAAPFAPAAADLPPSP